MLKVNCTYPFTHLQNYMQCNLQSCCIARDGMLDIDNSFPMHADVDISHPDEKSIMVYLVSYYHYFSKMETIEMKEKRLESPNKVHVGVWGVRNWICTYQSQHTTCM